VDYRGLGCFGTHYFSILLNLSIPERHQPQVYWVKPTPNGLKAPVWVPEAGFAPVATIDVDFAKKYSKQSTQPFLKDFPLERN
jgi:hypothetical protein